MAPPFLTLALWGGEFTASSTSPPPKAALPLGNESLYGRVGGPPRLSGSCKDETNLTPPRIQPGTSSPSPVVIPTELS
jgi:hypothetical protein